MSRFSSSFAASPSRARSNPSCLASLAVVSLAAGVLGACSDQSVSPHGGGGGIAAVGAGGGGGQGGAPARASDGGVDAASCTPNVCETAEIVLDPAALLSDFEAGVDYIPMVAGRMGSWWTAGDMTAGAVLTPRGAAKPEIIPGGRCGSQKALHVTGSGFRDWGATMGLTLNWGPNDAGVAEARPWNASGYTGITFWAKVGDTSGTTVRLGVSDEVARPEAGICVLDGGQGKQCYDTFGADLPNLDTTWKKYRVSFASLTQRGFGVAAPKLDTTQLYQIEFAMLPDTIFDFWLDDVSLY